MLVHCAPPPSKKGVKGKILFAIVDNFRKILQCDFFYRRGVKRRGQGVSMGSKGRERGSKGAGVGRAER